MGLLATRLGHCFHPATGPNLIDEVWERCCFCGGYRVGLRDRQPKDGHGPYGPMVELPPRWRHYEALEAWADRYPPAEGEVCTQRLSL